METKRKQLELWLGIILLTPPLISVLLFLAQLFDIQTLRHFNFSNAWLGNIISGGGYTSALPLYFGLMAIAGSLLISNSTKK